MVFNHPNPQPLSTRQPQASFTTLLRSCWLKFRRRKRLLFVVGCLTACPAGGEMRYKLTAVIFFIGYESQSVTNKQ